MAIAFSLFIIGPFLVVGWISAFSASEAMKDDLGRTMQQLVKQNHLTIEKTLVSVNDKTITFLDNHFFSSQKQLKFWTGASTLSEIREADMTLERWSSDGTEYSLYMMDASGKQTLIDMPYKSRGFQYLSTMDKEHLAWVEEAKRNSGTGSLQLLDIRDQRATVGFTRMILNPDNYNEALGFLVVTKLETVLTKELVSVQLPERSSIYLLDGNNEVLMTVGDDQQLPPERDAAAGSRQEDYWFAGEDGGQWLYAYSHLPGFNTQLIYRVPSDSLTSKQIQFQWVIMGVSAIYLLLVLLFVLYLLRIIVKPLTGLVTLTKIYEPGKNMELTTEPMRRDELGILYGAFVKMTSRLNQTIEENYVMKLHHKEMELSTLHSQITPHLLYNTLDSIYWYAVDSGNGNVGNMVKDLSKLLRIGLSKGKNIIKISEELEHAGAYGRLQLERYLGNFSIHWEVDPSVVNGVTPKVILQPLIENAIFYGVSSMDGEGEIWVRIKRVEDEIHMLVEDNGFVPIDFAMLKQLISGEINDKGYGIRNVHQRIQLHFGEAYGLSYHPRDGGGLVALIRIPL